MATLKQQEARFERCRQRRKSCRGEKKIVDQTTEEEDGHDGWGVFGEQSGFCFGLYYTEKQAKEALEGYQK